MQNQMRGSMVAIVTPMRNGVIHYPALEKLYRIHSAAGTDAVVVCGTTGESATLAHDEHEALVSHAADFFRTELGEKRPLLIAGTGSNATHEAVSLTEHAVKAGVDAVLVITPYYNKPTPRGQVLHFTEVAQAAGNCPVILYNVPGRTAVKMSVETIRELAEIHNIVAVKEASGDLGLASEVIRRAPEGFVLLSGEDNLTFPLMALGAAGVISVSANIVPELVKEMVDLCLAEQFSEARTIHQRLFSLTETLFCETNPIPVKTAINLMAGHPAPGGLVWPEAGELRLPLCSMQDATLVRLERDLVAVGLLAASEVSR